MVQTTIVNSRKSKILLVDGNRSLRAQWDIRLREEGYQTAEASTGQEALEKLRQLQPDAVVLDLILPDANGLGIVRDLCQWGPAPPVLIVSTIDDVRLKIQALDAGADDYYCRSQGLDEFLARLRAALRRRQSLQNGIKCWGKLEFDLDKLVANLNGKRLNLTPTETLLLKVLITHPGRVLTHQQILESVWGPDSKDRNHMLRVNICNLRKKLESDRPGQCLIASVPGIGYRFE